jgi:tRNA C32,U32 (ribose-2'-O)-methylase TrmJ
MRAVVGTTAPPGTAPAAAAAVPDRRAWAARLAAAHRGAESRRRWEPTLDPPPLLGDVAVALAAPHRPSSVGAVARACACFELLDLRLAAPRCNPLARPALKASKGAQFLLHRATRHEDVAAALAGAAATVAFARWPGGAAPAGGVIDGPGALLAAPALARWHAGGAGPLVLLFGREESGLTAEEIAAADAVCSIPIGRLQESLSLGHAVSLALAPLFEARLRARGGAPLAANAAGLATGAPRDGED